MTEQRVLKSIGVGNGMADRALRRHRAVAITRAKAVEAAILNKAATAPVVAGARPSAGLLVAEGDSWFDYPLHDVLKDLEDLHGFDVESVAHKGDRVEDMAYSDGQLDDFTRRIFKVIRRGERPKAILLSGGGNDIAGDEFAMLLNHALSPLSGLNESVVAGIIDQRLFDAYVTILTSVTRVCEETLGERIPVLIHGYGHVVPDGRRIFGGFWFLPGPWLEPGFSQKGYREMSERQPLIDSLIDRFNAMLISLTLRAEFQHVKYIDLRQTLATQPSTYTDIWANELHPTSKGFAAVAAQFANAL